MQHIRKIVKFLRLFFNRRSRYPQDIQLEVTNLCNFNCAMCPRDYLNLEYKDMPLEVARKCFNGLRDPKSITLTGWGEPLLAKGFFDVLPLANSMFPKARINFTTNGVLLNEENIRKVMSFKVDRINVSYEGEEDSNNISIMSSISAGHKNADQVLANLSALIEARGDKKLPKIGFQVVLNSDNFLKLSKIIMQAKELGLDFVNLMRLDWSINQKLKRPEYDQEQKLLSLAIRLGKKLKLNVFSINYRSPLLKLATHGDRLCPRTDNFIYVDVDGNVLPCCNLRKHRFGNVSSSSASNIWRNYKFDCFFDNQYKICDICDALSQKQKS
ncbi:MAG: radical SAM protein [Actinobacteria bacterium]|nr:radical SAM protein [Actinomycetota bacterium]